MFARPFSARLRVQYLADHFHTRTCPTINFQNAYGVVVQLLFACALTSLLLSTLLFASLTSMSRDTDIVWFIETFEVPLIHDT
jgi:hypothetical protein